MRLQERTIPIPAVLFCGVIQTKAATIRLRIERSAQAETGSLVKTDENGQVVLGTDRKPVYLDKIEFKNLEKYDRFENPYVYYAKETLDSNLGNYQAVYSDTDCAKNNGSITNNLAGTRNFVVEAEWKAAARQGGDASVTYVVQEAIKNDQGEITGWKNVGTPMMDAEGNYLKVKLDSEGNPVYEGGKPVYEITTNVEEAATAPGLTIDNFKAETMKQTGHFGPLPQYDINGNLITYRVVQTSVTIVDNSETTITLQPERTECLRRTETTVILFGQRLN